MRSVQRAYFDDLYAHSDDPWRIAGNWYEHRKRSLVAAMLPRRHFRHGFEPGCGSGELTLELGRRCERLLVGDFSETAVDIAQERWQLASAWRRTECMAQFVCMTVPQDWPLALGPAFDLIVISEFAYYLDAASLQVLPQLIAGSLSADGVLLACHWKRDFSERSHATAIVHGIFDRAPGLCHSARYEDADFLLDLWSREIQSVAQREALT